jgi:hypothetical protein
MDRFDQVGTILSPSYLLLEMVWDEDVYIK